MRTEKDREAETLAANWKALRNRLYSTLMSNNILKSNETLIACQSIDGMTHEARIEYITNTWGPLYAEKCLPLLQQMQSVEQSMAR